MPVPRKSFLGEPVNGPELQKLLDELPDEKLSEEQIARQRISFILGNAPESSTVTRESAKRAAERTLLT